MAVLGPRSKDVCAGGSEGTRTPNPRLAKAVLCQLSYAPGCAVCRFRGGAALSKIGTGGGLVPECALFVGRLDLLGHQCGDAKESDEDEQLLEHEASPSLSGWCGVGLAGIEPATSELSALRSNRLSYSPATVCG